MDPSVKVIQGNGRTLMSGLGDAHTHLTWSGGGLGMIAPTTIIHVPGILNGKQIISEALAWKSIHWSRLDLP